ncbi:HNH endonuclease [Marinirhabdus gelatinilytica]|uniref:HNH endonuclease n=1 Tax=Marinirhabdus gelatinilytica TaxID=1703343 RepID=A0A370QLG5_9FLAO|nr:HNH endonuclease [Marinirhabdus gelatinilytica]RDK89214.1 HNH endonuclease [Marinirhabdus gelatinilytica]
MDLLRVYKTIGRSTNTIIRNTENCIFCGDELKTNNKTHSHLIPELFGKNSSRNNFECDSCNELSGKWESSVGTFLTPIRIVSRIKNKRGKIPKFKSRLDGFDYPTEIYVDESGIFKGKLATMDDFQLQADGSGRLVFRLGRTNPFHIYKVFLKIALSLMPEEVLKKESWMKQHLFREEVDKQLFPCMYQIFTDEIIFPTPIFELKRLSVHHKYHPQYLLIAYFGKTMVEIILPIKKPKKKIVINMPPILEIQSVRQRYEVEKIDLCATENAKWDMTFNFQLKNKGKEVDFSV